ncbi:MAG: chorismate-binding protein [Flavobacteriaceae bacterium]|nr:chorismate-binding protein [Flavobacteriaceae bacterium]
MSSENFFNAIEGQYNNKLPFVLYSKPYKNEVTALLQKENTLYKVEDYSESGFVFAPFDVRKDTFLIPYSNCSELSIDTEVESQANMTSLSFKEADKEIYIRLVEEAKTAIDHDEFKKVVLSRSEKIIVDELNFIQIFKTLLNKNNSEFAYCWYHPKVGMWLGATPENLLNVEGHRFSTMALAGTQTYKGTQHVKWDLKEQEEQQFVTDFIEQSLEAFVESMTLSEVKTVKAGSLLHLKTDISGLLKRNTFSLRQLIFALHPTPAVCGYPKQEAMQFILDHENYNREFYTGFLGELNKKVKIRPRSGVRNIENRAYAYHKSATHLYVNLRCMQLNSTEAQLYVGGGITKDSIPENEWQETINKTKTMKSVLE